jgi:hypothetical protein
MKAFDFNINGVDLISGKKFASDKDMIRWTEDVLKNTPQEAEVIVSLTVTDRITPSHFIKYKFLSCKSENGKTTVSHTKF